MRCLAWCFAAVAAGLASAAEHDRQVVDIEMAKTAIAVVLLNGHSREGRYACSRMNYGCAGPDKGELGLALLRNIKTGAGVQALLEVRAFGLDADLSEDYACAVATGGPEVKRQLATVSAKRNHAACLAFFRTPIRSMPDYKDVDIAGLCLSEAELSREYAAIRKIRTSDCEE
jgi:hypothetical protein